MSLCVSPVLTNPHIHEHYTNGFSLFIQRLLYLEGIYFPEEMCYTYQPFLTQH